MAAAASPPPSPTISALILGVAAPAVQTGVGATDDFKPSAESAQKSLAAQGIKVEVRPHPGGAEGVKLSLEEVAKRIREGKDDPLVAAWARRAIQANGDPQDPKGRAQALLTQLRKDVSYVPDPVGTEMMIKPRYVLCLDPKGLCFRGGDCFPETTLLLRDDHTFVAIKDIRVGDRIWGHDKWTRVEAKAFKGTLTVDAVHMNNGSTFQVTADHWVPVVRCDRHASRVTSAPCQCPTSACRIEKVRVRDLKKKDRLLQPERVAFGPGVMDPGRAYVEGLYVSDGWHEDYRFAISGQDGCPKEAQKIEVKAICDRLGLATRWHRKYIAVNDAEWTARMREMGGHGPEKRLLSIHISERSAAETLRGVMADSGANTSQHEGLSRTFTTTSHRLMLQTRVLLRMFGVSCGYRYIVDHGGMGNHPIWRLSTRQGKKLAKILRVKAIDRAVRETPCYDIQTEDHYVYLPEADVTVHNCDDLVITYGSAALSVGIQTKIIGEAFNGEKVPSHVLAAIFDPDSGDWLRVDPSTPYPVGEYVAGSNEVWIDPLSTAPVSLNGTSGGRFVGVGAVPARHAVGGGPLGDIALVPPPASTVGRNLLACAAGAGLVLFVGVQVMNARHAPIKKAIASPRSTYKKAVTR